MAHTQYVVRSIRDVKAEEKLAWLKAQIAEMEKQNPQQTQATLNERIRPRIRRNGVFVDGKVK